MLLKAEEAHACEACLSKSAVLDKIPIVTPAHSKRVIC